MDQQIINWLLGLFGMVIAFLLNSVWQSIKNLQKTDKGIVDKINTETSKLSERIQTVEVLVAGEYLKKEEYQKIQADIKKEYNRLDKKLDDVFQKLMTQISENRRS